MSRDLIVQGEPDGESNLCLHLGVVMPTLEALVNFNMAFWSEMPDFPKSDHLTRDDYTEELEPRTERAKLYEQARERTLTEHCAWNADNLGGIPSHKFFSADGWHVTDKECLEALNTYEVSIQAGDGYPEALTADVVQFLRTAARHEGFRVY